MTPAQICTAAANWYEDPDHGLAKEVFVNYPGGYFDRRNSRDDVVDASGAGSFWVVCESAVDRDAALRQVGELIGKSLETWTAEDCKDKAHMIRMLRRAAERLAEGE
ncbi:MAG: hypothetical protein F4Z40_00870 [Chloroflexi bacterium]|nr:hypothetical protein [Chloroflexota bacterium]